MDKQTLYLFLKTLAWGFLFALGASMLALSWLCLLGVIP